MPEQGHKQEEGIPQRIDRRTFLQRLAAGAGASGLLKLIPASLMAATNTIEAVLPAVASLNFGSALTAGIKILSNHTAVSNHVAALSELFSSATRQLTRNENTFLARCKIAYNLQIMAQNSLNFAESDVSELVIFLSPKIAPELLAGANGNRKTISIERTIFHDCPFLPI